MASPHQEAPALQVLREHRGAALRKAQVGGQLVQGHAVAVGNAGGGYVGATRFPRGAKAA
jgi:hypothetical protein